MQGNTVKACIRAHAPYLSHLLKMDNLPQFCKHVSGNVLHAILVLPKPAPTHTWECQGCLSIDTHRTPTMIPV